MKKGKGINLKNLFVAKFPMSKKTLFNVVISILIVFIYFYKNNLDMKDISHPEIGWFIVYLYAGIYSIIVGALSIIIVVVTEKYWRNIFFLTSGLTNFVFLYVPISCIVAGIGKSGAEIFLFLMSLFPPMVFIIQLIIFIKFNKKDILKQ